MEAGDILAASAVGIGATALMDLWNSFGLGIALLKTPHPARARLKSLATHTVFGLALYLCALAVRRVLSASMMANRDCDDGNPCTGPDQCGGGACAGPPVDCSDGNPCTDDACSFETGCWHDFNTAPCDDQNPCSVNDTCSAGTCRGGSCRGTCPGTGKECVQDLYEQCVCVDGAVACGGQGPLCEGECPSGLDCIHDEGSGTCTCRPPAPCSDGEYPECYGSCPQGLRCEPEASPNVTPPCSCKPVTGTVTLVGYLIQVISGIFLLIYYIPHSEDAFRSVQNIMTKVPYGWLFRQMHVVGSNLMITAALLHLVTIFFMGNYKRPRELTWVGGVLMLMITLTFGLSGYLLPWTQLSYWATTVVTSIPTAFPVFGDFITRLLRGGDIVSGITLTRFFALHVALLPPFLLMLIMSHIALIRRIGLSATPYGRSDEEKRPLTEFRKQTHPDGHPYYPYLSQKQLLMGIGYGMVMLRWAPTGLYW